MYLDRSEVRQLSEDRYNSRRYLVGRNAEAPGHRRHEGVEADRFVDELPEDGARSREGERLGAPGWQKHGRPGRSPPENPRVPRVRRHVLPPPRPGAKGVSTG